MDTVIEKSDGETWKGILWFWGFVLVMTIISIMGDMAKAQNDAKKLETDLRALGSIVENNVKLLSNVIDNNERRLELITNLQNNVVKLKGEVNHLNDEYEKWMAADADSESADESMDG